MSEITALFFDVGGVVLSNGWDRDSREAASRRFDIDESDFEKRHEEAAEAFESGRMSLDDYLSTTVFYRPRPFSREDFIAFIHARSTQNTGTIEFLGLLGRKVHLLLATLNNESLELNLYRIRTFGLTRYFDVFLSSCYLGVRKPNPEIYRLALGITQRRPEQTVFIDDRPENLVPARGVGMRAIHFQNPSQLASELKELGIGDG